MAQWVAEQVKLRGLSDRVRLLGQHPVEAMPRYFALADTMLVTLKRDPIFSLTIPAKVQSYLACAKPIIAGLDGEGARVIEESGAGFAVRAEDPDALADAVLRMFRLSQDERAEMGRRGHAYFASHFEREMLMDRLEAWMNDLTTGGTLCES
jgi:glycosyltransferase involved in cell wall biosynthesis